MSASIPSWNPPPDPASRYPLREYDFSLHELVGWSGADVLARLGEANDESEGRTWAARDTEGANSYARDGSGKIIRIHAFGVFPSTIAIGAPYVTWSYHDVRGMTWLLFLTRQVGGWVVAEVAQYDTGAVF